ncbi:MAG: CotH kinase family protein, partial [Kiritimatiellae bacterium]|nr:CotH kinase family protein [Kiritimatiellia bacterium]
GAGLSEPEREAAWRRMLSLFLADPGFPLREPEARLLARRHASLRETMLLPDPAPGPEPLLGDNPAALYVTNDLDLAAAGPVASWRSSDPATVSAGGRVVRPNDGKPRFVVLTASYADGTEREYRFRVMPRAPALPALFLSFGRPLDKLSRTDFVCLQIPAGENPEPTWMSGTGPGGGGAKLRGNTSFVTGRRRPMNLEFDEPVLFPGVAEPVDHVLLLSGYADPTRLRNALSYGTFRAMSPGDTVRAAPVCWTEVFVNGAYAGVWECCPRLQDVLSESFSALYKVRSSYGLWTHADRAAEGVDRVGASGDGEDPYAPFRELVRFAAASGRDAFAAGGSGVFDVGELVDFWLLLNFTGNEDGRVTNQFVGRRAEDGRWMLMPWDYDKTFLVGRVAKADGRPEPLRNPLFDRLFAVDPSLRARAAARWRELRAGPLSDAALDAWIDERAALLEPFMDEDYRVVPPLGHDGDFADAIRLFRGEVHARAAWLDDFLSRADSAP